MSDVAAKALWVVAAGLVVAVGVVAWDKHGGSRGAVAQALGGAAGAAAPAGAAGGAPARGAELR